jgi:hypothetical protein
MKIRKELGINRNTLSKGISISIIKNIILTINRFTKELVDKVFHLTVKELVDLQFSMIPKRNGCKNLLHDMRTHRSGWEASYSN